jgi:hypothetical protein
VSEQDRVRGGGSCSFWKLCGEQPKREIANTVSESTAGIGICSGQSYTLAGAVLFPYSTRSQVVRLTDFVVPCSLLSRLSHEDGEEEVGKIIFCVRHDRVALELMK